MVTVIEAAQRLGKDPETIRRWIRAGKLPATKVGLQHMINLHDLPGQDSHPLPPSWQRTATGEPMPDPVAAVRRARSER